MIRQYEFCAWSKLIILKYKIIILNHRHEHRQDFNVYIKQYNTIQKQATLGLPWTLQGEKARGKPSNSLAKKKSYEPHLVNLSKHNATSWLWLVTILWPRRLRCCDRCITAAIKFIPLTALNSNTFTKANHKNQNGRSQLWRSTRNSYPDSPCSLPKVYIWVSDTFA